ncbi:hypothetical protein Tco_1358075 [Tanacetum coccineum]
MEDGIFFNQSKYIKEMLKKFGLEDFKPTKTLMSTEIKLTKDDEADSVDSFKYRVSSLKASLITRRMLPNTSLILELFCDELKKLITHFIPMISLQLPI